MQLSHDVVTDSSQINAWVISQHVSAGTPLYFRDLKRRQVIATTNILSGTIIASQTISVTWSPFEPEAVVEPTEIVNHRALRDMPQGSVILQGDVEGLPPGTSRVP